MAKHGKATVRVPVPKPARRLSSVRIEFPLENETVVSPEYTVRIAAPESPVSVDICIDQGEWLPCRESLGLWWFDWSGYDDGEAQAIVRVRMPDGSVLLSETRTFFIKKA